ncbi:unnamed protein product [Trichogramma brassicae]|uniref:Uncharacterized protein n=1 Tax=Trichogramma brassicae TaxID=86971 RepID=A0A6H5HW01_9HYME|nr:unnamed protein product [Trichogramma brassicae]
MKVDNQSSLRLLRPSSMSSRIMAIIIMNTKDHSNDDDDHFIADTVSEIDREEVDDPESYQEGMDDSESDQEYINELENDLDSDEEDTFDFENDLESDEEDILSPQRSTDNSLKY